jgi:hypothetical protein
MEPISALEPPYSSLADRSRNERRGASALVGSVNRIIITECPRIAGRKNAPSPEYPRNTAYLLLHRGNQDTQGMLILPGKLIDEPSMKTCAPYSRRDWVPRWIKGGASFNSRWGSKTSKENSRYSPGFS